MKTLFFIFCVLTLSSCTSLSDSKLDTGTIDKAPIQETEKAPQQTLEKKIQNCMCTQQWMPVCGENGKTYSNSCFAKCAGVTYHIGSCDKNLD